MIVTKEMTLSDCKMTDLWETPDYIFNPLNEIYRFSLDPCCTFESRKCPRYYTPESNGLEQSWAYESVFVNPPYSRGNIDKWVKKCYEERNNTLFLIALLPVSTSSKWFHEYVYNKCRIEFIRGRIKFKGAKAPALFSSMLCYYGKEN